MNSFSFKRLGLLLRREIVENGKTVLLALATLFGFTLIIFLLNQNQQTQVVRNGRYVFAGFYVLAIIPFGLLFIGMAFPDFRNKDRTTILLTIPATPFEKWLSSFLLTTIGFFIVFHIAAVIFYYTSVLLIGHGYTFKSDIVEILQSVIIFFLFLHSIFFLGATIFKRIPVLFSGLILIALFLLFSTTVEVLGVPFFDMKYTFELQGFIFNIKSMNYGIFTLANFSRYIWFVFPIILWIVSFFKFKEKEIA